MVDLLLKAGASLSVVDNMGRTTLHTAAMNGCTELVDILLKAGANLFVVDNAGWTPLHIAALTGHTEVADLLLKAGASHSVMDKDVIKPSVKLRKSNINLFKLRVILPLKQKM